MILITGATGLVGSHLLLHLLENGQTVRALFNTEKNIAKTKQLFAYKNRLDLFEKINWTKADILDIPELEKAFEGIEYVYHCAAFISFDPKDEEKLRKTNIEGTANVANCCLDFGVKKLCYVSSIAALGDLQPHEKFIDETTEWNPEKPHSDYAISKHGAEMEVWRTQEEGLKTVIVNPGVILGPVFWKNGSSEIFHRVKSGLSFYTSGKSGFVAVDDLVKIMTQLMSSEIEKERFVVVAENIEVRKIANTIADVLQKKRPTRNASPTMLSIAWRLDWLMATFFGTKRKLSRATAKSLHTQDLFSNEKMVKTLNFTFTPIEDYLKKVTETLNKK